MENKIVAYFMVAKKLIKFQGEDNPHTVSDKVMEGSNFKGNPIKKGASVDVVITDDIVTELTVGSAPEKEKVAEKEPEKKEEAKVTLN